MGVALPLEIRTESFPELYKILDISINLSFNEKYYICHPILLPIPIINNSLVLITSEIDHLDTLWYKTNENCI